jgi:hypothetical protein
MKTLRILLATSALLLAFSAAFASTFSFTYYHWRLATSQCVGISYPTQCYTIPNFNPCTVLVDENIVHLRETNVVANQCGASMFRVPL